MAGLILIFLALAGSAKAAPPGQRALANSLSAEAERSLSATAGKKISDLKSDAEKNEWAQARLAWISLLRLQGREKEARRAFVGCEKICEKFGRSEEWKGAKAWGCALEKKSAPCGGRASEK